MAKKKQNKTPAKKKPAADSGASARKINRAVKELEKFYKLGQRVLEADQKSREDREKLQEQKNGKVRKELLYSPGVIVGLVKKVGMSKDYIHKARNFAETYTPEQFETLKNLSRPDGMPLGRRHIIMLMRIKNKSLRNKYQRWAASKGWSITEIAAEVSKLFGRPGGAGGRKPQRAVDIDEALVQISRMTNRWGRWYDAYVPKKEKPKKNGAKKRTSKNRTPKDIDSMNERVCLSDLPEEIQKRMKSATRQINALKKEAEGELMKLRKK